MTRDEIKWIEDSFERLGVQMLVLSGFVLEGQNNFAALKQTLIALRRDPNLSADDLSRRWDVAVGKFAAKHDKLMPLIYASAQAELRRSKRGKKKL